MKKIIAFADTKELEKHYGELEAAGGKLIFPRIIGICGGIRRAEIRTNDGDDIELVYIHLHLGDLLLHNREADEVHIDHVLKAMDDIRASLLNRVRTMHIEAREKQGVS